MLTRQIMASAFCIGLASWVHPQTSHTWTADEWIHHVFEHHVARSEIILEPEIRRQTERSRFTPQALQAGGFYLTPGTTSLPDYTEWQMDQSGVLPPVLGAQRKVVSTAESAGLADQHVMLQSLWWSVSDQVWSLHASQSKAQVILDQVHASESLLSAIELRHRHGEATFVDVEQARLNLARIKLEKARCDAEIRASAIQLNQLCGGGLPTSAIFVSPSDSFVPYSGTMEAAMERASVEADVQSAQAEWELMKKRRLPEWSLGYNAQGLAGEVYGGLFVGFSLPVHGARRAEELGALEVERMQLQGARRMTEAQAQREVWAARYYELLSIRPVFQDVMSDETASIGLYLALEKGQITWIEVQRSLNARFEAQLDLIQLDLELRRLLARLNSPQQMTGL
jgi:outer membrane protein TolC